MATYCLTSFPSSSSSSSSSSSAFKPKINPTNSIISSIQLPYRFLNTQFSTLIPCPRKPASNKKIFTVLALVEDEQQQASNGNGFSLAEDSDFRNSFRPYELYICNLPRNCGIPELLNLFKSHGTVQSVEVPRNPDTGISRGCGYVTMSSLDEAKAAISALDGSDVDGREMRVKFSVHMNSKWGKLETLNPSPQKNLIFETPYKVYVGNLAWSVKPEDLRNLFSQFGTVVSTRVLHDRKGGKNRVYGFLSFSSSAELKAAMSLNGTEYSGRVLLLREVPKRDQPDWSLARNIRNKENV